MALGLTSCGGAKVDYSPGNGENTDDSVGTETAAGQQAETSGLARELSVPESCEVTFDTGESGLSSITLADEKIEMPDAERAYRVSFDVVDAPCSESELKTIVGKLFDDTGKIRYRSMNGEETKEELDELIEQYEDSVRDALAGGDTTYAEALQDELDKYLAKRDGAADELPPATEFKLNENYIGEKDGIERSFMAVAPEEDGGMNDNYFTYEMTADGQNKAFVSEVPGAEETYVINVAGEDTYDDTEANPITETDAVSTAMGLFDALGLGGFACVNAQESVRAWTGGTYGSNTYNKPDGYRLQFERQINGMDVEYFDDIDMVDNVDIDNLVYSGGSDRALITVNKSGVVSAEVHVYADEDTFVSEEVTLLSWDELIKAAGESIGEYYAAHPTNYGSVEFNDVRLAYVPCAGDDGEKYFVPAWIFSQSEFNEDYGEAVTLQLVYVNAIDGSCIDIVTNVRNLGLYEDIAGK